MGEHKIDWGGKKDGVLQSLEENLQYSSDIFSDILYYYLKLSQNPFGYIRQMGQLFFAILSNVDDDSDLLVPCFAFLTM